MLFCSTLGRDGAIIAALDPARYGKLESVRVEYSTSSVSKTDPPFFPRDARQVFEEVSRKSVVDPVIEKRQAASKGLKLT